MDKLKLLVASKRKATEEEFAGKKYVKRSQLEQARLAKVREQGSEKVSTTRRQGGPTGLPRVQEPLAAPSTAQLRGDSPDILAQPALPKEQAVRRLRLLKQPATLFGESDAQRQQRLLVAERNVHVDDEAAGGQQANVQMEIARADRGKGKASRSRADKGVTDAGCQEAEQGPGGASDAAAPDPSQAQLMADFQAAADAIAEQGMAVEDRVAKWLRKWMQDWEEDLDARPEEVKASPPGRQADVRFKETQQYLRPLLMRLKARSVDVQMLAGIKLIVDAMKDRNYLHAYKIYMGVAIGNAPWPIGVTQVGLHERSAREKISFKYASGSAHIMNDEATRKFIQALKRLMTFCQRRYPTDPSRCVDFDGFIHDAPSAVGAGSDKTALLEAVARGEVVATAPAPSHMDGLGAVKIPEKWDQVIRGALE